MSRCRDRREAEEYVQARLEEMLPRAAELLAEAAEKGDRRALKMLDRIKRERPDLLPSPPTTTQHDPAPTAPPARAQRARDRAFQRSLHRRP
jgi:hypothetical protein